MGQRFLVIPAIDVLEGRCVRLRHGEREQVTVEGGDPAAAARRFAAEGAPLVHLVDLDGAFSGTPTAGLVARVAEVMDASGLPVLAAGGIATLDEVRRLGELGCEGAVVGSALWLGRFTLAEALAV